MTVRSDASCGVPDDPPARTDDDFCCPVCGGEVRQVKCKVVCARCRAIVVNCSGD